MNHTQRPPLHEDVLGWILSADRKAVLSACAIVAVVVAGIDFYFAADLSVAVLYTIPLAIAAVHLGRIQVVVCALAMSLMREQFRPNAWHNAGPRLAMDIIAFGAVGLLIAEIVQSRMEQIESMRRIEEESVLREKAVRGARAMIESSPAAMITVEPDGRIEMTNEAATRLLGLPSGSAQGQPIAAYFPILGELIQSKRAIRLSGTMLEGNCRRSTGENFFAQIWLSSYETPAGTQLAAVIADASDQLRDREELGLRQLLMSSRIIAAAVSHEIRNMAAAAAALHGNVGKNLGISGTNDFQALGELIEGMRKLATAEVPTSAEQVLTGVDMNSLLRELNIVVRSEAEDAGIELVWEVADNLPEVRADRSGLLQVLLNLSHNSIRELGDRPGAKITVAAYVLSSSVLVRFSDNGPGISRPEMLFQPFQTGASATGLGLCISRAIIRTFGGELRYVERANEGCFLIELPAFSARSVATS